MYDKEYNELNIGDYVCYIGKSYTGGSTLKRGFITGFKKYFGKDCAIIGDPKYLQERVMQQSIQLISKGKENESYKS